MPYKKCLFLQAFFFFLVSVSFSQSLLINPIEVKRDDNSLIRYYLDVENPDQPSRDLFLFLQGSDCNSVRKIKAVDQLKAVYPEADLLTVEKYGISDDLSYCDVVEREDYPEGYLQKDNPEQRVSDLDRVVSALRDAYSYERIIVMGGSEGALVANLYSSRVNYIAATLLLGGGGRFFLDDVLHSMNFTIPDGEEREKNKKGFLEFARYIQSSEPFDLSMSGHGYSWWRTSLSIDQLEVLKTIDTPVLIVQGGEDDSSSTEKASEMVDLLQKAGKTNIDYYFYPGYDHSLNLSVGDGSSEIVLQDIVNWLRSKMEESPSSSQ